MSERMETQTTTEAVTGHLDGVDDQGRILFRPDGESESHPVTIGLPVGDAEVAKAAWLGRRALVLCAGGRDGTWVLTGFLRERVGAEARDAGPGELAVQVDGEAVKIQGQKRIELVCGKARLVLEANGHIEWNGSRLVQRSRGPIKIKGATIDLN